METFVWDHNISHIDKTACLSAAYLGEAINILDFSLGGNIYKT